MVGADWLEKDGCSKTDKEERLEKDSWSRMVEEGWLMQAGRSRMVDAGWLTSYDHTLTAVLTGNAL